MEQSNSTQQMLALITRPAFCVETGVITCLNQAAKSMCVEKGMPVADLLPTDLDAYTAFRGGSLYLTVTVLGISSGATVSKVGSVDVFILDDTTVSEQLRALALAGQHLRAPLSNLIATFDTMVYDHKGSVIDELRLPAYHVRKAFHQLHRVINNMSDAAALGADTPTDEVLDVVAILEEAIRKSDALLQDSGIPIHYASAVNGPVFAQANRNLLERAFFNLLSNAVKFSKPDSAVDICLSKSDSKLTVCVKNKCGPISAEIMANIFHYYQRKPNVEDGRFGIGLGMTLIRAAAQAHGGTALVDQPDPDTFRVTLSLAIRQSETPTRLRNRLTRFLDYSGGSDHALLELSEVLPSSAYGFETK